MSFQDGAESPTKSDELFFILHHCADSTLPLKEIFLSMDEKSLKPILNRYQLDNQDFTEETAVLLEQAVVHSEKLAEYLMFLPNEWFSTFEQITQEKQPFSSLRLLKGLLNFINNGFVLVAKEQEQFFLFMPNEVKTWYHSMDLPKIQEKRQQNQLIFDYISASINLYATLSLEQMLEVIKHYEPSLHITVEQVQAVVDYFYEEIPHFICEDGWLIAEFLTMYEGEFEETCDSQAEYSRYYPGKKENFLKYRDHSYHRTFLEEKRLTEFLLEKEENPVKVKNVVDMANFIMKTDEELESIFKQIQFFNLSIPPEDYDELMDLLYTMNEHTRKFAYNGFTEFELEHGT